MRLTQFLALPVFALFFMGCNNVEFRKTSAGVPYKVFSDIKGDSIRLNQYVKFEVIQKTKDTVLFSSYAQNAPQYLQVMAPPLDLNYSDIAANIMEILPNVRKGDSVYMVQVTDSLIAQSPEMAGKTFKKGDQLITTLKIVDVYKTKDEATAAVNKDRAGQVAQREKDNLSRFQGDTASQNQMRIDARIIEEHLSKNNIKATKTDWGAYVQVTKEGQGPKPTAGQYVLVKYAGRTLAGVPFDSGEFPMQVGVGGSIKGFEEGVRSLSKGGAATVYIPSRLAYGPVGSGDRIRANENLVFDIEILEISDNPIGQQQQPQHYEGDGHGH